VGVRTQGGEGIDRRCWKKNNDCAGLRWSKFGGEIGVYSWIKIGATRRDNRVQGRKKRGKTAKPGGMCRTEGAGQFCSKGYREKARVEKRLKDRSWVPRNLTRGTWSERSCFLMERSRREWETLLS